MLKKLFALCFVLFSTWAWAALDVNKASEADLVQIKGIGPAIASNIVETRKQGAFKNWDDLIARVKGVGAGNADKFSQGGLTIDGKPYKAVSAPATPAKQQKTVAKTAGETAPGAKK